MSESNAQNIATGPSVALDQLELLVSGQKLPPVDRWDPPHRGHSAMRIAADGRWFHEGRPIARPALVRLFASILRREPDGRYMLVTPGEKLDIDVADAPFVAVELASEGEGSERRLAFRLNTDEWVIAGPAHPLRVAAAPDGTPRPYLHVRYGLEALVGRSLFYELADLALRENGTPIGLWSNGAFFVLESDA